MSDSAKDRPDTTPSNRIPPGQHLTKAFPVLHYGSVPKFYPRSWKLRLFGLVEQR